MRIVSRALSVLVLAGFASYSFAAGYTYRASGTVASNSNSAALSPGAPAGKQVGDLLLLFTSNHFDSVSPAAITGWTLLYDDGDASIPSTEIWARVADGTSADTPTVDWTGSDDSLAWISAYSGDVYTDLATIVAHSAGATSSTNSTLSLPTLTITTDNTLVVVYAAKIKSATSNDTTTITAPAGHTKRQQVIQTGNAMMAASASAQQTTATNYNGSDFTRDGTDEAKSTGAVVLSLKSDIATPLFTVAPNITARTSSSITIGFTSDTTGTVYGARLTDGSSAPTCDQLEAQTATGAVQYWSEAVVATVGDSHAFTSVTDGVATDGYFCIENSSDNDSTVASIADMYKLPDFTAGPTAGTITSSAIPFTFTLDETGTVYGVACPDGQASPTVAQVKAGNCTGNITAQASFSESVVLTVSDAHSLSGLAASTTYDTHFAATAHSLDTSAITSVANQTTSSSGAGVFTVTPTVTSQTTVQYVLGGTTGASQSIAAVACAKDETAPTIAQVQAGHCTGNVSARAAATDTWNGADSLILGGSLPFPIYDLYITDGTTRVNLLDEVLDVPSAKQRLTLASVHATSPYFGLGVAANDICTIDDRARSIAATPDAGGYVVTDSTDGTIEYASGVDDSRRFIVSACYDVSSPQNLDFLFVFNDEAPNSEDVFFDSDLFEVGTVQSFDLAAPVVDPESDDVDYSVVSGALPTGTSLDAETGELSGLLDDCGHYSFSIRIIDPYGAFNDIANLLVVGPKIPNVAGLSEAAAIAALEALCP